MCSTLHHGQSELAGFSALSLPVKHPRALLFALDHRFHSLVFFLIRFEPQLYYRKENIDILPG